MEFSCRLFFFISILCFSFICFPQQQLFAAPELQNASYDATYGRLELTFSEPLRTSNVQVHGIFINIQSSSQKVNCIDSEIMENVDPTILTLQIKSNHNKRLLLEAANSQLLHSVSLQPNVVLNTSGEGNRSISNFTLAFFPNSDPVKITNVYYDASSNKLSIYCDRPVINVFEENSEIRDAIDFAAIKFYDQIENREFTLKGQRSSSASSKILSIDVLPEDQHAIESAPNPKQLFLQFDAYCVMDSDNHSNIKTTPSDSLHFIYFAPDPTHAPIPIISSVVYDADTNELVFEFENISSLTGGIDANSVICDGIGIDNHVQSEYYLSPAEITGVKSGTPSFVREIRLNISESDTKYLEFLPNKENLELVITPASFFFERTTNGNIRQRCKLEFNGDDIIDEMPPEITALYYDPDRNECRITFSTYIKSDFEFNRLKLNGVPLTGTQMETSDFISNLALQFTNATAQAIESQSIENQIELELFVPQNLFFNTNQIGNPEKYLTDGDLDLNGKEIRLGYCRYFPTNDYQVFSTKTDSLKSASLRGAGKNYLIFVSDENWYKEPDRDNWNEYQNSIRPLYIEYLKISFEQKSNYKVSTGSYQVCLDLFEKKYQCQQDKRLNIVLTNFPDDDYTNPTVGQTTFYLTGVLKFPNIVKPVSGDTLFGDGETIYLNNWLASDSRALLELFSQLVFIKSEPDEDEWIVKGISRLLPYITGFYFRSDDTYSSISDNKYKVFPGISLVDWPEVPAGSVADVPYAHNALLFQLYLFLHLGGENFIKELARNPLNGVASVSATLAKLGYTQNMEQAFLDFATAGFLLINNDPTYGNRFGFNDFELALPDFTPISDWSSPIITSLPRWSFYYYSLTSRHIPEKIYLKYNPKMNLQVRAVTALNGQISNLYELKIENDQIILPELSPISRLFLIFTRLDDNFPEDASFIISDRHINTKTIIDLNAVSGAYQRVFLNWSTPYLTLIEPDSLLPVKNNNTVALRKKASETSGTNESGNYHFSIWRSKQSEGPFFKITDDLAQFTFTDAPLQTGQCYYYQIKAIIAEGDTVVSSVVSASPGPGLCNLSSNTSNYGSMGKAGNSVPACEWPIGSGCYYLYHSTIWIGAVCNNEKHTTYNSQYSQEWQPTGNPRPESDYKVLGISTFSDSAVYDDLSPSKLQLLVAEKHYPLGLLVTEKTRCFPKISSHYDDFFIKEYSILNTGINGLLSDIFIGWYYDGDAGMGASTSGAGADDMVAFDQIRNMPYMYDADNPGSPEDDTGEFGRATGYMGLRLLKSPHDSLFAHQYWISSEVVEGDENCYDLLAAQHSLSNGYRIMPDPLELRLSAGDYRFLLSTGPFNLKTGESLNFAMALVLGEGLNGLQQNADFAKQLYDSLQTVTSVPKKKSGPITEFRLNQNYPNPFNTTTRITYQLPYSAGVKLEIFNILGQRVKVVVNESQTAGQHEILWNGVDENNLQVASGIYLFTLWINDFRAVRKMVLLK